MAITFNVSPTKDRSGFGVYVKALSGIELFLFSPKLPELSPEQFSLSTNITTKQIVKKGAIRVFSDRIAKFATETKAKAYAKSLSKMDPFDLTSKLWHLYIKPTDKDFKLAKLQYFQLHRDFSPDTEIMQFTTQNKDKAVNILSYYGDIGVNSRLHPTIARNVKLTGSQFKDSTDNGVNLPAIPHGINGMLRPIKDLGGTNTNDYLRRITGKRKRTTSLTFWNNK